MSWDNLSGLLWLLAIGALFYWMMKRGGCGMQGHSHGGGHGHGGAAGSGHAQHEQGSERRDPVCGMTVDPDHAAGTRSFGGRTFQLCSQTCIEKFDGDPGTYVHQASDAEKSSSARSGHRRHGGC